MTRSTGIALSFLAAAATGAAVPRVGPATAGQEHPVIPTSPERSGPAAAAPVVNILQLGGIETSVLDDGPGRGVRIAWVNTGGGLRYKVVIDRGLDIADAEFRGDSLTWLSFAGVQRPDASLRHGLDWLSGFPGGLVVGCGPMNIGEPCTDAGETLGLHGTHSNTPARIESIINPDPARGRGEMSITGIVRTARLFGPEVELRRTIRSTLGVPSIRIRDEFMNRGNTRVPHAWLLHMNFGYPLLEPGASTFCYRGAITPMGEASAEWFREGRPFRDVPAPQEAHRGAGEVVAYIDPQAGPDEQVVCGVVNRRRGFGVRVEFSRREFPRLGNWQHWGPDGSYVAALEPMSGTVDGRDKDRQRGLLRFLGPGETIAYEYTIHAVHEARDLAALLAVNP
jgi:hypothetical protein